MRLRTLGIGVRGIGEMDRWGGGMLRWFGWEFGVCSSEEHADVLKGMYLTPSSTYFSAQFLF